MTFRKPMILAALVISSLVLALPAVATDLGDGGETNSSSSSEEPSSTSNNNNNNNNNTSSSQQQQQQILVDEDTYGDQDGGCDQANAGLSVINLNLPLVSCNGPIQ